jgi:DNA primase catalytic core
MTDQPDPDVDVERLYAANAAAWDLWTTVAAHPGSWVPTYLAARGLGHVSAGHAQESWTSLLVELQRQGFTLRELNAAGLVIRTRRNTYVDRFRNRLVLPVRTTTGQIAGFTARKAPSDTSDAPKYLNTNETAVYRKSDLLYGLDPAALARLAAGARPVLVEGALDAEAVNTLGEDLVAVAPCGTALTPAQFDVLRAATPDGLVHLIAGYDADTGGVKATARLWELLRDDELEHVRVLTLPEGFDPAGLLEAGQRDRLHTAIERSRPLSHFVIEVALSHWDLREMTTGVAAARAIAPSLVRLPHPALADAGLHLIAQLSDLVAPYVVLSIVLDAFDAQTTTTR